MRWLHLVGRFQRQNRHVFISPAYLAKIDCAFNFDPLLIARPPFFKVTIWLDNLLYGPFYLIAIYAYIKGKEWIRLPSIVYAVSMISGVNSRNADSTASSRQMNMPLFQRKSPLSTNRFAVSMSGFSANRLTRKTSRN